MRSVRSILAVVAAGTVAAGCGSGGNPTVEAGAGEVRAESAPVDGGPETVDTRPAADFVDLSNEELEARGWERVVHPQDFDKRGYVVAAEVTPGPGKKAAELAIVMDAKGKPIAYMAQRVGWIDKQVVEAPDFDLDDYVANYQAETERRIVESKGQEYLDAIRRREQPPS